MRKTLQELADYCFLQGYSSTHFMRVLSQHPDCPIELNQPAMDCYHPSDEPELLNFMKELGYLHTVFGFIQYKVSSELVAS